jgi:hypothetical protein
MNGVTLGATNFGEHLAEPIEHHEASTRGIQLLASRNDVADVGGEEALAEAILALASALNCQENGEAPNCVVVHAGAYSADVHSSRRWKRKHRLTNAAPAAAKKSIRSADA